MKKAISILLSIHPKYVNQIINGTKLYEYRKRIPTKEPTKIYIYSTSPIKKIIGEINVEKILFDGIDKLWNQTKEFSGISKNEFYNYFLDEPAGYAYKLKNLKIYKTPKQLKDFQIAHPPQNFLYVNQ